jgi:hypothetical protein
MIRKIIYFMFVVSEAFNLLDLCIVPEFNKFIYISTKINTEQVSYIKDAINKFNLIELFDEKKILKITDTKMIKHTRIEYGESMGLTDITARLYSDNKFHIQHTLISFRPDLVGESLVCVILHELLHSVGVTHNELEDSIMNISITVDVKGNIIQHEPCNLSLDDVLSILN